MLHARLTAQPHLSLLEQDLEFLSDVSLFTEVMKVNKVMKALAYTVKKGYVGCKIPNT